MLTLRNEVLGALSNDEVLNAPKSPLKDRIFSTWKDGRKAPFIRVKYNSLDVEERVAVLAVELYTASSENAKDPDSILDEFLDRVLYVLWHTKGIVQGGQAFERRVIKQGGAFYSGMDIFLQDSQEVL